MWVDTEKWVNAEGSGGFYWLMWSVCRDEPGCQGRTVMIFALSFKAYSG